MPLIIWPSLVSTLLQVDGPAYGAQYSAANASLEKYFARSLGLSQIALGGLLLVLSGALPLDSTANGWSFPSRPQLHTSSLILSIGPFAHLTH